MATATEAQENRPVKMVIEKGDEVVGVMRVAEKVAELMKLLLETEKIEVRGQFAGQRKIVGGGTEDEEVSDGINEMKSLIDTLGAWIKQAARSGQELEIIISIV